MPGEKDASPLVNIGVFCYNTGKKMIETLDSVMAQTYRNIGLIIVDDGSTDNSVELIQNWIESNAVKCIFLDQKVNRGLAASINNALRQSNGKYFGIIGDDIMLPDKIEDDVNFLENNPEYGFCHSGMETFNEVTGGVTLKPGKPTDNLFHDYLGWKTSVASPTILYKRKVFDEVGFYDETLDFEDFDMILRISYKFKSGYRDKISVRYRITGTSIRTTKIDKLEKQLFVVIKKWDFLDNYKYYLARNHLCLFYNYSTKFKIKSLKYIPLSFRFLFDRMFYASFFRLFFKWHQNKPI